MIETKIARVMNEVKAPMKMYEMSPAYYGAALIAVTTGEDFLRLIRMYGEDESEYLEQIRGNEHKVMILPGIDLGQGVAVAKSMGHFFDGTIEEALADEGYVIMDLGL
jgi:hypothetical protein